MFKYGQCELEVVDKHKYLGIVLNWHLYKYKLNKGFGYDTYQDTKLYHSGVIHILGLLFLCMDKIDTVQN